MMKLSTLFKKEKEKMTTLQVVKTADFAGLRLDSLVYDLGISPPANFPHSFSECFHFENKQEEKTIIPKLSGFSRTLKGAIPSQIDSNFLSTNDILTKIIETEKIKNSSAFKTSPKTIEAGLPLAVAFIIIRDHKEAEQYPELMEMRKVIESIKMVQKYAAKGSHKGEFSNEMQTAIQSAVSAQKVVMLTQEAFFPFFELATMQMLEGNEKAKQCLLTYKENKN